MMKREFQQLVKLWQQTIADDHKDADCHFFMYHCTHRYSYGEYVQESTWNFHHDGYILGDFIKSFDSEQAMYAWACQWLEHHISAQTKYNHD